MGHCKSSVKGKVHSNTGIPQETRKSQINNLTLHLKQLEKEEMKNPRISRRKEILKNRAEINAKETKEAIAKINKAKSGFFEKINKIDFKTKAMKRQRRTLHNDQRMNLRRRYNNYKYICTQHRSTTIYKANVKKYERGN